jgi:hypothetical protein
MKYTIISAVRHQSTITTTVQVESDGIGEVLSVSHFNPSSVDVIHENIVNRILSDINQKNSEAICEEVLNTIEFNKEVEI